MDVYTEKQLKLMSNADVDAYFKALITSDLPLPTKMSLLLSKVEYFAELAKQDIMKAAMDRKADQERRRHG